MNGSKGKYVIQNQQHYKSEIKRLSQQNEQLQKANKKLREQLQILQKQHYETKTKLSLNQSSMNTLNLTIQQMTVKLRELQMTNKKFYDINQACYQIFHVGLDEAIFHGYLSRKMGEKESELEMLAEEVEELKFLNQRRILDYDELRKQNYQMQLRLEEMSVVQEQVEELRVICDKLEQEKKEAVFREEVLKVQLQNMGGGNENRDRLQRLRIEQMLRRATNSTANRALY